MVDPSRWALTFQSSEITLSTLWLAATKPALHSQISATDCGCALTHALLARYLLLRIQSLLNLPIPKPGRIPPWLCSFPVAYLSHHRRKTPNNLSVEKKKQTTQSHPKFINYSMLEIFWWILDLPRELTTSGFQYVCLVPTIQKEAPLILPSLFLSQTWKSLLLLTQWLASCIY